MTIIDYFNQFWRLNKELAFTSSDAHLYFYLLSVWNNMGRADTFPVKTISIETDTEINKKTILRSRERLRKRGLINFRQGSTKGKYAHYILQCVTDSVTDSVTESKEKVSPTPPLKEIYSELREKERISKDIPKKDAGRDISVNYDEIMKSYNEMLSPPFPRCTKMTKTRKSAINARISENGINSVSTVFKKVKDSEFLRDKRWCGFDWIFKPTNYLKILEGNYDNAGQIQNSNHSSYCSKQEANDYALNQFLRYREARDNGLLDEVEKPF